MRRLTTMVIALLLVAGTVFARDVVSSAGSLKSLIGNANGETELKVTGTVDVRDLRYVADSLRELTSLDLSGARIAAYGADKADCVPAGVFAGSQIANVKLPSEGSLTIGEMAFLDSRLRTLVHSNNISVIGLGAFAVCHQLENISLEGVSVVGASAFAGCETLKSVTNTVSLTSIGEKAFADCLSLESFEFGKRLLEVGEGAFAGSGIRQADMSDCGMLESVGGWAFARCRYLLSAVLPQGLEEVSPGMLFGCVVLTNIKLPADAAAIGDYALADVSKVEYIHVPGRTDYIGSLAMAGMDGLQTVNASELSSVPELGEDVWKGVDQPRVTLKIDVDKIEDFKDAEQWNRFNIAGVTTGIDDVTLPEESGLKVTREGDALLFTATAINISSVKLYNISGQMLIEVGGDNRQINVPLPQTGTNGVLIAEVVTDSGIRIIRKISID